METILVQGFLEAGKTSYIQATILQDFFYKRGSTLILCFEYGETEYDEAALSGRKTSVVYYENGEDITAFCVRNIEEYAPDRIYVEMNSMIPGLREKFPDVMEVSFVTTLIDFPTMGPYLNNMRQYVVDIVKGSSMVTFRNCPSKEQLAPYSQIFKLINPKATYLRRDPKGYHERAFDLFLPYSLDSDPIPVGEKEYLVFFLDAGEHPEHYENKKLRFSLPLEVRADIEPGLIKCGRTVMTCCMADIQFMGCPLLSSESVPEIAEGWIFLEAGGCLTSDSYGQKRLALQPVRMQQTAAPESLIMNAT